MSGRLPALGDGGPDPRRGCGHVGFPAPSPVHGLGSPSGHTLWLVFQNARRNTGSPRFLLRPRGRVVSRGAFRAPSLDHQLISGPFHPPSEGAFQRSLTLLVRYRSRVVFSLSRSMPAEFTREFQPPLLWYWRAPYWPALRGYHPVSRPIPGDFTRTVRWWEPARTPHCPKASVWAVSRSLAVTNDIPVGFSSCPY